ncbi:MAG: hypothetical protein WCI88_14280 [Chloroflexota bacterium]
MDLSHEMSTTIEEADILYLPPSLDERAAIWVSGIFSPVVISLFTIFFFAWHTHVQAWRIGIYLVLAVILPVLYTLWLIRRGYLSDFHMNIHSQRIRPMIVITLFSVLAWAAVWFTQSAADTITIITGMASLETIILAIITLRWKISGHACSISGLAVLLLAAVGYAALPVFIIIPLVIWARVHLGRHTLSQACTGALTGALFSLWAIILVRASGLVL